MLSPRVLAENVKNNRYILMPYPRVSPWMIADLSKGAKPGMSHTYFAWSCSFDPLVDRLKTKRSCGFGNGLGFCLSPHLFVGGKYEPESTKRHVDTLHMR